MYLPPPKSNEPLCLTNPWGLDRHLLSLFEIQCFQNCNESSIMTD